MNKFGFVINSNEIKGNIFIPKYYDPETPKKLKKLRKSHTLIPFGELKKQNVLSVSTGDEVGKMAYGTGDIPFVRTSDISNWEIKFKPKQGISKEIYEEYKNKQDIRADDIFLVRDGTYLVGNVCMLTDNNSKILYQSHILKIRVEKKQVISPYLLLAVLSCPIVLEQIKSKQFTADIIDTLGNRINEIILPIPKNLKVRNEIIRRTKKVIYTRSKFKKKIECLVNKLEKAELLDDSSISKKSLGFKIQNSTIKNDILLPKYYDPQIDQVLKILEAIPRIKNSYQNCP